MQTKPHCDETVKRTEEGHGARIVLNKKRIRNRHVEKKKVTENFNGGSGDLRRRCTVQRGEGTLDCGSPKTRKGMSVRQLLRT